ncbi:helix-turn-helix transcriptional regulator [Jeotgalibacillus soli]|uniref:Helix-turn-helix domain-containing protein n=1 Tax=Jeotgalibacillus soli TaxID=889306 RepID=A0A0C2R451_9BACL|nr:hypothetical protein [Jeotgalibacillus soli]KIL45000.1 hypothetical protein KP78_25440 [Jeotgalibacillus soli]
MLEIKLDEAVIRELYLEELRKRLDKVEKEALLMGIKELLVYLGVSRSTFYEVFQNHPELPRIHIGRKSFFYRPQIDEFIKNYIEEVQANGGQAYNCSTIRKVKAKKEEREGGGH